jgi:hypothetical protein
MAITGARLLLRFRLDTHFPGIPAVIWHQRIDYLIGGDAREWLRVLVDGIIREVPTDIHGDFTGARSHWVEGWEQLISAVRTTARAA